MRHEFILTPLGILRATLRMLHQVADLDLTLVWLFGGVRLKCKRIFIFCVKVLQNLIFQLSQIEGLLTKRRHFLSFVLLEAIHAVLSLF